MNWKIGQKLVYIGCGGFCGFPHLLPKKGEVVTVCGVTKLGNLELIEYDIKNPYHPERRIAYCPKWFRPLLGESARTELIISFVEVTETSDCPINVPQTETTCS